MSERQDTKRPDWETAQKIADLLLSLRKPGTNVYIDIAVRDGQEPDWEYTEKPSGDPDGS